MADPHGLNGLVFGTEDAAATFDALAAHGVPATPPNEFTRPVELPDGAMADARFRTVHIQPASGRPGRLYFCHHFTRELVWRDAWRHHANGAVGIVRAVIASDDPAILGRLFATMFGDATLRPIEGRRGTCRGRVAHSKSCVTTPSRHNWGRPWATVPGGPTTWRHSPCAP